MNKNEVHPVELEFLSKPVITEIVKKNRNNDYPSKGRPQKHSKKPSI